MSSSIMGHIPYMQFFLLQEFLDEKCSKIEQIH